MGKDNFINLIKKKKTAPFLFVGSGFTKHYLSTPKWNELLNMFAPKHINAYYSQLGTKDLTAVASEIAKEVNSIFWELPEDNHFKKSFQNEAINPSSVLKKYISSYLKNFAIEKISPEFNEEIELLKTINIDGIITTNWDDLIESIFPKFNTYVGQDELIFSPTYNIGEIYKIHGCVHQPESLVLTKEDYNDYVSKNAYLAAKLLTVFIEHPIIFIGYSINDPNIQEILSSIVKCLSRDKISILQDNLFFVEWNSDEESELVVNKYDIKMENNILLPVTRIITHNFKPVFECLKTFERNIPTHVLRFYKKNFYEIVYSENPEKQLCVIDENKIDLTKEIQYVAGFGAITKYKSAVGYTGLKSINIFKDIIFDIETYEPESIITKTLPDLRKSTQYIPCYKYLKRVGIESDDLFKKNKLGANCSLLKGTDFRHKSSNPGANIDGKSVSAIIEEYPAWKAASYIPYMEDIDDSDLELIKEFCKINFNSFLVTKGKPDYSTQFKKLICFYDWKKYGWE